MGLALQSGMYSSDPRTGIQRSEREEIQIGGSTSRGNVLQKQNWSGGKGKKTVPSRVSKTEKDAGNVRGRGTFAVEEHGDRSC